MLTGITDFPGGVSPGLIEATASPSSGFGERAFPGGVSPGLIEATPARGIEFDRRRQDPFRGAFPPASLKLLPLPRRELATKSLHDFPGGVSPGLIEAPEREQAVRMLNASFPGGVSPGLIEACGSPSAELVIFHVLSGGRFPRPH